MDEEDFSYLLDDEDDLVDNNTATSLLSVEEDEEDFSYLLDEEELEDTIKETEDTSFMQEDEEDFSYLLDDEDDLVGDTSIIGTVEQDNELEDFTSPRNFDEFAKDRGYMESWNNLCNSFIL